MKTLTEIFTGKKERALIDDPYAIRTVIYALVIPGYISAKSGLEDSKYVSSDYITVLRNSIIEPRLVENEACNQYVRFAFPTPILLKRLDETKTPYFFVYNQVDHSLKKDPKELIRENCDDWLQYIQAKRDTLDAQEMDGAFVELMRQLISHDWMMDYSVEADFYDGREKRVNNPYTLESVVYNDSYYVNRYSRVFKRCDDSRKYDTIVNYHILAMTCCSIDFIGELAKVSLIQLPKNVLKYSGPRTHRGVTSSLTPAVEAKILDANYTFTPTNSAPLSVKDYRDWVNNGLVAELETNNYQIQDDCMVSNSVIRRRFHIPSSLEWTHACAMADYLNFAMEISIDGEPLLSEHLLKGETKTIWWKKLKLTLTSTVKRDVYQLNQDIFVEIN